MSTVTSDLTGAAADTVDATYADLPLAGGAITIAGTHFYPTVSVTVGSMECSITASAAGSITCTAPALASGTHDVVVTANGGDVTKTAAVKYWGEWWQGMGGVTNCRTGQC